MSHPRPPWRRRYAWSAMAGACTAMAMLIAALALLAEPAPVALTIVAACLIVACALLLCDAARTRAHIRGLVKALAAAATDPVTGLALRGAAQHHIDTTDPQATLTAAVVDVRGMHIFNKVYGRAAGDLYLRAIADRLLPLAGPGGMTARLRDGEMAVISLRQPLELAAAVDEALHAPVTIYGRTHPLTVTVGISQAGTRGRDQVIGMAVLAMLTARRDGNRICVHDPFTRTLSPFTSSTGHTEPHDGAAAQKVVLACPVCGATELATLEEIPGSCPVQIRSDGNGGLDIDWGGDADVDWNGQLSVGVRCARCPWSYTGPDWHTQLAAADPTGSDSREDES